MHNSKNNSNLSISVGNHRNNHLNLNFTQNLTNCYKAWFQLQCSWPSIENAESNTPVKAFILADTHLLGPRKGHWLDKWRREWQMHQAYMAILTIHKPDVIFVLGKN